MRFGAFFSAVSLRAEKFHDGLRARLDVEFFVDRVEMRADGAVRNTELVGDFLDQISLGKSLQDLLLAGRQFLIPGVCGRSVEEGDYFARDLAAHRSTSVVNVPDCIQNLVRRCLLQEVAGRARCQRLKNVVRIVIDGKHNKFAGDLLRMYMRFAEKQGWKTEVIDVTESDLGGYKDISIAVKSKGTPAPGQSPYAKLKFEGGVHRVQRVPETESQGRIHTSAAGVLVLPEAEEVDVELNMNDVRVDVYRSSGPGGQSVNTTDSAVRLTHVPTGIVVSCQNEKSQLQNKESAMRILRARLLADAQEKAEAAASAERKSQVRTVDRSERIRTYNFPENRLSDHRVNYKANNLDAVLNGDLDDMIDSLLAADKAEKLASQS